MLEEALEQTKSRLMQEEKQQSLWNQNMLKEMKSQEIKEKKLIDDLQRIAKSSEIKKQSEIEKQRRKLQKNADKFEKEKVIETKKE